MVGLLKRKKLSIKEVIMGNFIEFEINIPSDSDGYVPLKCFLCGEEFMLKVDYLSKEDLLCVWCPGCGICHEEYFTDEVVEVAERIATNHLNDMIAEFQKNLDRTLKGSNLVFRKPKAQEYEVIDQIQVNLGDYTEKLYKCCNEASKIKSIRSKTGGYCPFCGGVSDGNQ
jgi:DNA-directed RNA polymerase subunit RPC12/RpoP